MQWKDFFYFSHGERRALTLLLFILTFTWILLSYPDFFSKEKQVTAETEITPDTIMGPSVPEKIRIQRQAVNKTVTPTGNTTAKYNSSTGFPKQEKFPAGTVIELNSADTTLLKKIPGIGSAFANRIIKYRNLLGGFYSVEQLAEVYGIDEERFLKLKPWFYVDKEKILLIDLNQATEEELRAHPYINYRQAGAIVRLRKQKGTIHWENLLLLEEFSEYDKERLYWYILTVY
ncbi:MAG: helix-hairpin-helix domain-containing protein [Tannerellaceae bacterium]|nr:helix-hairpin-helix domain-containing protein [Tannerellaceae bacterium]